MKRRFTNAEFRVLSNDNFSVIENDDQEPYALGTEVEVTDKKSERYQQGFSAHYSAYYIKIVKNDDQFTWYAAPATKDLSAKGAAFMGVFDKFDQFVLTAIRDIIWEHDLNPLPERLDFQIQRVSTFEHKH